MSESPSLPDTAQARAMLAGQGAELARHAPFSAMTPSQVSQFIEAAQPRRFTSGAVVLQPVAKERVDALLNGFRLFRMGWSWGGFESLAIPIWPEKVRTATRWDAGGPCLRLSIGLEDPDDLIADLAAGLARLAG